MSHPNPPLSHFKAVVFLGCIFLIGVIVLIIRPTKAANLRAGTAASFVTPKGASSGGGIANVGRLRPTNVTIANNAATNAGGGIYNPGIGILKFNDTLIANAGDVGAYAASTFEVNSTDDSTDGSCTPVGSGNGCTLREAIERANVESGAELITFAASLTSVGPATITLSNALPDLSSDMNITGPGATLLTIQRSSVVGTPDFRIFTVPGPTVSIAALTVTNGKTRNGSAGGTMAGNGAEGGAIHNSGTLTMQDVLVISNRTGNGGNATFLPGNGGSGGGIYNAGSLTMTNCTVSGNNAGNGGSGGTGSGGGRGGDGGGIYSTGSSLALTNVIVSNNTAGSSTEANSIGGLGGGIFNHAPTTASMTNCTVSGNSSGNASGPSSTNGFGGGIQNNGALTVIASTMSGNTSNGPGGGLMNQGSVTLVNTTISGNSGIFGGGIYDDSSTSMFLTNCTITNNTASNHHGVITDSGGNARVRNTVIAGNGVGPDVTGFFTSQGNNLIGISGSGGISGGGTGFVNGSNGDQVGSTASPLNALLGILSDNGGPTQTHALLADSTAIDAGNNCVLTNSCSTTLPSAITDDQRGAGFSRNVDGLDADTTETVDIGAFEAQVSLGDIADQTINEDGSLSLPFKVYGALSITSVTATSSNTALVPNDPANISISGSGSSWTLSINPLANASGTSTITVTVNANDGQTVTNTFLLTVNSVNDVPSFSEGVDQTVNEDAGLQMVNWATLMSAGPANEGGQTLSFTVTNNNNALFSGQPVISSAGTLSYTPAANANGMATVSVALKDSGGTANGGQDTATVKTFDINVTAINDAPSFSGADRTANENDSAQTVANWATNMSPGPLDESGQALTFQVTGNTNSGLFSAAPAISSAGTLTYTPAANANGSATISVVLKDNGGIASGGQDTSAPQTFTITINPVNDQPSFTSGPDQTVNEDAGAQTVANWATNMSPGPLDESGQTLTFQVTGNTNPGLFSAAPAISSTGTLTYTPAANANGSATISVVLKDNGGIANGGQDTSAPQTFNITINPVNDQPSFTSGPDQTVNEDAGAQTVANWATAISAGTANESAQTFTFNVTNNTNPGLFSAAPAISSAGTLTYTPAANANGSSTITVVLKDDGGIANGGQDTSFSQSLTISVTSVNDAPSFTKGPDQNVSNNAGVQTVSNWATGISAGPANESAQSATFLVTGNTNPGLFAIAPSVSPNGSLTYQPASNAGGTATISIALRDNGGTANGGQNTSAAQTFDINVNPVGGFLKFESADFATTEGSGFTVITVKRSGDTSIPVTVNYATSSDPGLPCATANGVASPKCDFTSALGTLTFAAGEGTKTFTVLVNQDSFVEGPETLTVSLSNQTAGAALTTPSTATVTIDDDVTEPPTNSIDDPGNFVRQHYHDFLNREPDADGLAFWSNQITECQQPGATCNAEVRRINVSAAFFVSIEFRETGYLVYRFYKAAFGNITPTPVPLRLNEFLPDTQQIGQGVVVGVGDWQTQLESNKAAFAQDFVSRLRFVIAYPTSRTPEQFVDGLFANAAVTPSTADRNAAINEFGTAGNTADTSARARALRRVAENATLGQQERDKAFVLMQYFGYLRRNPNDAPEPGLNFEGYNFWLNKLNQFNGNYITAEMVKAFIDSSEYRQRFGP